MVFRLFEKLAAIFQSDCYYELFNNFKKIPPVSLSYFGSKNSYSMLRNTQMHLGGFLLLQMTVVDTGDHT
jgi:hypothetical protein